MVGLLILLLAAGCHPAPVAREPWNGKTLPIELVIDRINANNQQIPTLWARQDVTARLYDQEHKRTDFAGSGHLLYRNNGEMRVEATNELNLGFELGATPDLYWMKVNAPGVDTMWWGHTANVGKPCSRNIPIQPALLLDVLGIGAISTNLTQFPAPVMHFQNTADAYVLDWVAPLPTKLLLQREVWYDRRTLLPMLVLLFDENGRAVLSGKLSAYQSINLYPNGQTSSIMFPLKPAPQVATRYELIFPDTQSQMVLTLRDIAIDHNGVPHAGSIKLPDLQNPGVKTVKQIDLDCDANK